MTTYTSRGFAIRRVRNGRVRICGVTFAPNEIHNKYDGSLDGLWLAFGRYHVGLEPWTVNGKQVVSLWGTEAAYRSPDPETDWPGPNCVDGIFRWEWWDEISETGEQKP